MSLEAVLRNFKGDYSSLFTPKGGTLAYDPKKGAWLLTQIKIKSSQKEACYANLAGALSKEANDKIINPEGLARRINEVFHSRIACTFKPNHEQCIYFNSNDAEYSFLSNFHFPTLMVVNGKFYQSAEHAYQDGKRVLFEIEEKTDTPKHLSELSPLAVKKTNKNKQYAKTVSGELVCSLMRGVVRAKFTCNPELGQALCNTSIHTLVENTDSEFWGRGRIGKGANHLGAILMELRNEMARNQSK